MQNWKHIVGKIGRVFNLAIWRHGEKSANWFPPILNPTIKADWSVTQVHMIMYCTSTSR